MTTSFQVIRLRSRDLVHLFMPVPSLSRPQFVRMYGGVGGGSCETPPYPAGWLKCRVEENGFSSFSYRAVLLSPDP
jgi:hypothetical protein